MALILLVTTNLFHTALSQSSVCIWGSDYKSGLYTDSGSNTSDGKSYYTKSAPPGCTDNDYYIYYLSIYDEWTIGNVLGEDYYIDAYCTANTSSLSGCTTNTWWKYSSVNSSWEFSPDMYVSMNVASCPTHTWDCDTIHIPSLSSGGCDSVFDVKLDTNLWTESTNTWYWYWNEWYFHWQCDNEPPSSGACSALSAYTNHKWIAISSGQSATLQFEYPAYTSHTVNCIMNSPTSNPTSKPTSKLTLNPTSKPTVNPTLNPTSKPTLKPTLNPTLIPTLNPTLKPTLNPTPKPTRNTTLNPTLNPTLKPTLNPTPKPTRNTTLNPTLNPTL
eukprot:1017200_1